MRKKAAVHTVPSTTGKGWDNVQNGEVLNHSIKKSTAQDKGRRSAIKDQTEHRIHNKNGQISESNSYGNDPCPPKDKNK